MAPATYLSARAHMVDTDFLLRPTIAAKQPLCLSADNAAERDQAAETLTSNIERNHVS
jgi:hypothetical protein